MIKPADKLIGKYNTAAPRYTSYPTVPYWDKGEFDQDKWAASVKMSFDETNRKDGLSIYIHLPFCESGCTYCGCNTRITKNHQVEDPYIKDVIKEWKIYREIFDGKPVIREIHLGGGTPTFFSARNLKVLIDGILEDSTIHPQAEFGFEAHPCNTTVDHLQVLFDLGFRRLSLGIQDFDPRVQLIINRIQSFEQVKTITLQARRIGYTSINYDLIYGLPCQTLEGIKETIRLVNRLMPDRIAFYSYAHIPWIKPGQRKFTENELPDPLMKSELYECGRMLFDKAGYQEIGMDHFALRTDSLYKAAQAGRLHRNFMGYTHQYTRLMIGLGVSAISDTGNAFAQNVKELEEYHKLISIGILPLFRGHFLTGEDSIIRKHISDLMCRHITEWDLHSINCNAVQNGIKRLQELAGDGLVELTSHSVTITPLGRRFLRNICMAFDARLWADKPGTPLFSMTG